MKFLYLGTAAAEGIPALFCMCNTCTIARKRRGRELRSRCQAIINDELLLDFGPDTYMHTITQNFHLENVNHVLITHDHQDHFYVDEMEYRRKGYASKIKDGPLHVYGTTPIVKKVNDLQDTFKEYCPNILEAHLVTPFIPFDVIGYKVTPLEASHSPHACPVIYHIQKDNKSILYGHDTGWFSDKTWDYLSRLNKPLDFVSIDCTGALLVGWDYGGHLAFESVLKVKEKMEKIKAIDKNTKFVINHFSHNGNGNHKEMVEIAKPYNIYVAYDGMEVTI